MRSLRRNTVEKGVAEEARDRQIDRWIGKKIETMERWKTLDS